MNYTKHSEHFLHQGINYTKHSEHFFHQGINYTNHSEHFLQHQGMNYTKHSEHFLHQECTTQSSKSTSNTRVWTTQSSTSISITREGVSQNIQSCFSAGLWNKTEIRLSLGVCPFIVIITRNDCERSRFCFLFFCFLFFCCCLLKLKQLSKYNTTLMIINCSRSWLEVEKGHQHRKLDCRDVEEISKLE